MRNPAIPLEVCYPLGVPEEYSRYRYLFERILVFICADLLLSRRRVNIDFSNIPDDQPYADKVFVDSNSKQYWIDK